MNLFGEADGNAMMILQNAYAQSQLFTTKPITTQEDPVIHWNLKANWFLSIICQVLREREDTPIEMLFSINGWNYKEALDPTPCPQTTVEAFTINDIVSGAPESVLLHLECTGDAYISSQWMSNRDVMWTVIGNDRGYCELESEFGIIHRYEMDLKRNFEKVA